MNKDQATRSYSIEIASTPEQFQVARDLFREYAATLSVDLCFQNFDKELQEIDLQYGSPAGALMLVMRDGRAIGCGAIRKLEGKVGELKRMYLRPDARGLGVGSKLLSKCFEVARRLGYDTLRLDTLPEMTDAQAMYRKHGFYEISSYRSNPVKGSLYMEKRLT
ncbi:MAG: GNAT family N-acetyltransferase [Bacteroidetes bacterium]|nr:GNAT family N-acetyltransferase [Bacteroidota bacterium]